MIGPELVQERVPAFDMLSPHLLASDRVVGVEKVLGVVALLDLA